MKSETCHIVIVDDHALFAKSLKGLIETFENCHVKFLASNGIELEQMLAKTRDKPDLILLDVQMPERNGFETMAWLQEHHEDIKVIVLSMDDDEDSVIKMIHLGANGYVLKDADPAELKQAMKQVFEKGYYHSDLVSTSLLHALKGNSNSTSIELSDREAEFLKLACSELTYKEIAQRMYLSPKTIDGYRDTLFRRFEVRNRVGLVIFALSNKLMTLEGIGA